MAYLEVLSKDGASLEISLEGLEGRTLSLGRTETSDLQLDHVSISRKHATLSCESDGYSLTDLGSKHGTRANGVSLLANMSLALTDGHILEFGGMTSKYVLRLPDTTAPPEPEPLSAAEQELAEIQERNRVRQAELEMEMAEKIAVKKAERARVKEEEAKIAERAEKKRKRQAEKEREARIAGIPLRSQMTYRERQLDPKDPNAKWCDFSH
eukprot:TRINITY_DN8146_c0_g1_i1.p1 TRINITY_DN8146_c0_g1~~TRINITY_DN8146_c0_g1_i1.p1  ORF type:complete len:211 (-),score=49.72 TRINITY_DN8146_c0_g1_i1:81-713(-)